MALPLSNRLTSTAWGPPETPWPAFGALSRPVEPSLRNNGAKPDKEGARPEGASLFRTLLVPLDGSPLGEGALPLAVSIARQAGAELRLAHVHTPLESMHGGRYPCAYDLYQRKKQTEYLEQMADQVAEAADVRVVPQYMENRDVIAGLCDLADRDVDLVITATHGYGWLERLWYGSTVHRLVERMAPPMLVLRGDWLRAAISPDKWLEKMLVCLDGSRQNQRLLGTARALTSLYGASLSLLGVVPAQAKSADDAAPQPGTFATRLAARQSLRRTARELKRYGETVESHVLTSGDGLASAINRHARRVGAHCIAIAAGGPDSRRWFRPSLPWQVIRLSQAPVLVVRSDLPE